MLSAHVLELTSMLGISASIATLADLETRTVRLLKQVDERALVFDEVHSLLCR